MLTTFPVWKIAIQVLAVGGLMALWTCKPDPLRRFLQLGILSEALYAMLQDQVSVRLCPEYFTVGHPRIEGLTDPTLLGIAWGFLGAWWGGALLGVASGFTARLGSRPRLDAGRVLLPVVVLLAAQAVGTALGAWWGSRDVADPWFGGLAEPLAGHVPADRHAAFVIVARMHQMSYLTAILGSPALCGWIAWKRWRLAGKGVA